MPVRHPYRRGDVILVPFPFSQPGMQKSRAAIVLSTDDYHEEWDELLVVGITSVPPRRLRPTDCFLQDWQAVGLHKPSWVRSHLATVHRQLVLDKIGALLPADRGAVEACLRRATGL